MSNAEAKNSLTGITDEFLKIESREGKKIGASFECFFHFMLLYYEHEISKTFFKELTCRFIKQRATNSHEAKTHLVLLVLKATHQGETD